MFICPNTAYGQGLLQWDSPYNTASKTTFLYVIGLYRKSCQNNAPFLEISHTSCPLHIILLTLSALFSISGNSLSSLVQMQGEADKMEFSLLKGLCAECMGGTTRKSWGVQLQAIAAKYEVMSERGTPVLTSIWPKRKYGQGFFLK